MIRVSPGASPSAGFAPPRDPRAQSEDRGGSFEHALGGVETVPPPRPKESARPEPKPKRAGDEEPPSPGAQESVIERSTEATGAAEQATPGAGAEAAPEEGAIGTDAQGADGGQESRPVHKTEAAPVRIGGESEARRPAVITPAIPTKVSAEPGGPAATSPEAVKPEGSAVGGVPEGQGGVPKSEATPDERAPDDAEPRARGGKVRPKGLDGVPGRLWPPKQFVEPRVHERGIPALEVPQGPDVVPGTGATAEPAQVARAPVVPSAQDVAVGHQDARMAADDARVPSAPPSGHQNTGDESQAKGDGAANQWPGAQRAAAMRTMERAESASAKPEVGGVRVEESAPVPAVRTGAEMVGAMGLGRAPGALRGAPGSAGSAPSGEKGGASPGLEGAVTRGFSAVMRQNGGSVVIRLSPESLGPVRISMSVESTNVSVMLEAGTVKAHELLTNSLGSLRQSLEAQGLRVERMGVTLSGPHPTSSGPAADGSMPQRGSEDSGFGDQDAADGRSRGHADQESPPPRDRHGGDRADPTHPFGTFSELVESSGTAVRFVATA